MGLDSEVKNKFYIKNNRQHLYKSFNLIANRYFVIIEDEVKEISDEEDWQFVTIGDQVTYLWSKIKKNLHQIK